jgi:hypothetical protein
MLPSLRGSKECVVPVPHPWVAPIAGVYLVLSWRLNARPTAKNLTEYFIRKSNVKMPDHQAYSHLPILTAEMKMPIK